VVSQVVVTMEEIHQSARKISEITGVIDGIAFQTNILALNAAVEAARAGEQGLAFGHREVVQQAQGALVVGGVVRMGAGEEVAREAQLVGKAGQHLHGQRPAALLEVQRRGLEARQLGLAGPELRHARAGDLVALLLVRRAGGRPHLGAVFPAGVGALGHRVPGFHVLRQSEEAGRVGEHLAHAGHVDAVVHQLEEAHLHRGRPELLGDLGAAGLEVAHIDAAHLARLQAAGAAHAGFQLQFVQGVVVDTIVHLGAPGPGVRAVMGGTVPIGASTAPGVGAGGRVHRQVAS
jgi:hypothetical protein